MKRRRSILLDPELDRRVERRARERGVTYTDVVREALEAHVSFQAADEGNPFLDLIQEIDRLGPPRPGPRIDIDSPEGKLQAARDIYRRKMDREPDW